VSAAAFLVSLVILLVLGLVIESLFIRSLILGGLAVAASLLRTRRHTSGQRSQR
jgi:hypothetical protein